MRICVVGSSKYFFSGLSTHTVFLANALKQRGHDVCVILLRKLVPQFLYPGKSRVGKGEYIVDFLPGIRVYNGMDWNSPLSWLKALKFINIEKPEAIVMLWWTSSVVHMQILLALTSRFNRMSVILEMHEVLDPFENKILPLRLYSRIGGYLLMNLCHRFTVPTKDVLEAVTKTYRLNVNNMDIVPIAAYEDYSKADREVSRKELNLDGFVILHFGAIKRFKGISLLVKAFELLPKEIASNSYLVIAGENWGDDHELEPSIKNSPYSKRILYLPEFVPDEMVPKYFAASDVVVLPYLRTCGSGVAYIAVAQGKAVIASDLETMYECLEKYEGVRFFKSGDIIDLGNKLIEVYHCRQEYINKKYSYNGETWNDIAINYENIIKRLAVIKLCVLHK